MKQAITLLSLLLLSLPAHAQDRFEQRAAGLLAAQQELIQQMDRNIADGEKYVRKLDALIIWAEAYWEAGRPERERKDRERHEKWRRWVEADAEWDRQLAEREAERDRLWAEQDAEAASAGDSRNEAE